MSNFEIKTHRPGRTYNNPHFFILNKGLNSGKPMRKPCLNCFVITAESEDQIQTLFYMCLSLKTGRYFEYYIKGSVIPFITITDCLKVLKKAHLDSLRDVNSLKNHIHTIKQIQQKEELLKQQLKLINQLKVAFIQNHFSINNNTRQKALTELNEAKTA